MGASRWSFERVKGELRSGPDEGTAEERREAGVRRAGEDKGDESKPSRRRRLVQPDC